MSALPIEETIREAARAFSICNACRYCEGFCAVFPAMTRRLGFGANDVHYLANLCHNCGACLHACQYAPPHEFAVNVPKALAEVRGRTYADYAWPRALAALYRRNGLVVAMATIAGCAIFLAAAMGWIAAPRDVPANFYSVLSHGWMVVVFAPVFGFATLAMTIGVTRFWRDEKPGPISASAAAEATSAALTLRYLDGGHGDGCNEADDRFTLLRRRWHHLTFYGFVLCFLSTCAATVEHYVLGRAAPYPWTSVPKLLGMPGGVLLAIGCVGLATLRWRRHPQHAAPGQRGMDLGFIFTLFTIATSGLALPLLHARWGLTPVLCVHLGAVLGFFALMPYGKFAQGIYRMAALLKYAIERRQPLARRLGGD